MSFSGSVQFGGPRGFSSNFEISGGKPEFEFRIGGGDDESARADAARPALARQADGAQADQSDDVRDARSDQFLDDVKAVKDSSSKRALIDNFVKSAIRENQAANAERREAEPANAEAAQGGAGDKLPFAPVMKELQGLAGAVDESKLPEGTQNKLLDGIASLASELNDVQAEGGDLRQTAMMGMADLAKTLDQSRGGEKAKGAIMDKIAESLTNIATGDFGDDAAGAAAAGDAASPAGAGNSAAASASGDAASSAGGAGPWTHSVKDGKAEINLGDKYTISAQEDGEAWTVKNNETGAVTKISGDPHVDVGNDGKNDWDFKKDMTFQLDDGTKITVGTVPADNGTTYSSSLTITNGDKVMQVSGLAGDHDGKNNLEIVQSAEGGETIDDMTLDGFTVVEDGANWAAAIGGETIDQQVINDAEKAA